jgi:hypothetical protein
MIERIMPAFTTENFEVFRVRPQRRTRVGFSDNYLAFWRAQDVSEPICIVTVTRTLMIAGQPYVEWVEVNSKYRRQGVATEVCLGL